MATWKPYDQRIFLESNTEYFLIRPCGTRNGDSYTPSVVRCTPNGVLIDPGGNMVRLNHHRELEWTKIPE